MVALFFKKSPSSHAFDPGKLSVADQKKLLRQSNVTPSQIRSIKQHVTDQHAVGKRFLRKSISLDEMNDMVQSYNTHLAKKMTDVYGEHQARVRAAQQQADATAKKEQLRENIQKTRRFDQRRRRLRVWLEQVRKQGPRAQRPEFRDEDTSLASQTHTRYQSTDEQIDPTAQQPNNQQATTSIARVVAKKTAPESTTTSEAATTIKKIQQASKNLPDLPI